MANEFEPRPFHIFCISRNPDFEGGRPVGSRIGTGRTLEHAREVLRLCLHPDKDQAQDMLGLFNVSLNDPRDPIKRSFEIWQADWKRVE